MRNNEIRDDFEFADHLFLDENEGGDVVAKYYSAMEAEVAAARLRSEGIPCFIAGETAQAVMTHLSMIVRLHVRPEDLELAREILTDAAVDTDTSAPDKSTHNIVMFMLVFGIGLILLLFLSRLFR